MAKRRNLCFTTAFLLLALVACENDDHPGPSNPANGLVTVTGTVRSIDDQVPVDGGVTIELLLDTGATELLYFGSLFTSPPPSEEMLDLYQVILGVEVEDRVQAVGTRREGGISLEGLTILKR